MGLAIFYVIVIEVNKQGSSGPAFIHIKAFFPPTHWNSLKYCVLTKYRRRDCKDKLPPLTQNIGKSAEQFFLAKIDTIILEKNASSSNEQVMKK